MFRHVLRPLESLFAVIFEYNSEQYFDLLQSTRSWSSFSCTWYHSTLFHSYSFSFPSFGPSFSPFWAVLHFFIFISSISFPAFSPVNVFDHQGVAPGYQSGACTLSNIVVCLSPRDGFTRVHPSSLIKLVQSALHLCISGFTKNISHHEIRMKLQIETCKWFNDRVGIELEMGNEVQCSFGTLHSGRQFEVYLVVMVFGMLQHYYHFQKHYLADEL